MAKARTPRQPIWAAFVRRRRGSVWTSQRRIRHVGDLRTYPTAACLLAEKRITRAARFLEEACTVPPTCLDVDIRVNGSCQRPLPPLSLITPTNPSPCSF